MFKWLTRNDGRRAAKAGRRLKSPRGAVFAEFALIMPIALLVCSALIELAGFWDAEVMANHTAWQVGRIAMVRGHDGMSFAVGSTTTNSIGFPNRPIPTRLRSALNGIDSLHAGSLADRGKITALFMMSTCGIGYFGKTPRDADPGRFGELVTEAYTTVSKTYKTQYHTAAMGVLDNIANTIATAIVNKVGADSLLGAVAKEIFEKILIPLAEDMLSPIIEKLVGKVYGAVEKATAVETVAPVATAFSAGVLPPRIRRQLYGAALRASENRTVVVTNKASAISGIEKHFIFSNENPLRHPLVADTRIKHDGYFVTSAAGWPPAGKAHRLLRIDVQWPYEAGWLFPVVSGYGSTTGVTARGHSMVFPQPNLMPRNLYSVGAAPFEGPTYNPDEEGPLDDLSNEITSYMDAVLFSLKYRICEEYLSYKHSSHSYVSSYDYKWYWCPQLMQVFGLRELEKYGWYNWTTNKVPCYQGDYFLSWSNLTENAAQQDGYYDVRRQYSSWSLNKDTGYKDASRLKKHFKPASYHARDYFHWDGSLHNSYQWPLCEKKGQIQLDWEFYTVDWMVSPWYAQWASYSYRDNQKSEDTAADNPEQFQWLFNRHAASLPEGTVLSCEELRQKVLGFARRNKVNISNLCKWQTPGVFEQWKADDEALEKKTQEVYRDFTNVVALVEAEIKEIEYRRNHPKDPDVDYSGFDFFDADSMEALEDPQKTADRARKNWEETKRKLRQCLKELDELAVALRRIYAGYSDGDESQDSLNRRFTRFWQDSPWLSKWINGSGRVTAGVYVGFPAACIKIAVAHGPDIFDEGREADFFRAFRTTIWDDSGGPLGYPIARRTTEMLDVFKEYEKLLLAAWEKEKEFGSLLGLESAEKYPAPGGQTLEDITDPAGMPMEPEATGTLEAGNDHGLDLIDKDNQQYMGRQRGWEWK